jgi:rsbT co-antagonist protein RsbR
VNKTRGTRKTKEQLASELAEAQRRIAELEASEAECRQAEESQREALAEALEATHALRESEARYRSIVESINIRLNLIDRDHNIIIANAAQGRSFGKSPHEMVGKKCFREFEGRDTVCPHCPGVQAIATGRFAEVEIHRVGDGIGRFVKLRAFPTFGQDGTVSGFIESVQDITESKRAAEALRESEERYRLFSDATTEAVLLHKDGMTIDVNQSFLDMYGYDDPSELIGKNSIELTIATPEDREKIYQNVRAGGTGPYEVTAKRADDGTTFPIEINARQIHHKGESVRVVLITNITERKQAEAERERLQQEIIEAQRRALQELSTPIIPVLEGIIVVPLIGSIDTMRARDFTRVLLAGIREHRAKVVILDITGVPIVDSGVADHLNRTIQAARLKGARTIVTGISDAVAETIVDLGIDWSGIQTLRDLQTGLRVAMVGIRQRDGTS